MIFESKRIAVSSDSLYTRLFKSIVIIVWWWFRFLFLQLLLGYFMTKIMHLTLQLNGRMGKRFFIQFHPINGSISLSVVLISNFEERHLSFKSPRTQKIWHKDPICCHFIYQSAATVKNDDLFLWFCITYSYIVDWLIDWCLRSKFVCDFEYYTHLSILRRHYTVYGPRNKGRKMKKNHSLPNCVFMSRCLLLVAESCQSKPLNIYIRIGVGCVCVRAT